MDKLKNEFSDLRGYSERNLGYMLRFANEYQDKTILQQLVAKLPWGHNLRVLDRVKDPATREWYLRAALEQDFAQKRFEGGNHPW